MIDTKHPHQLSQQENDELYRGLQKLGMVKVWNDPVKGRVMSPTPFGVAVAMILVGMVPGGEHGNENPLSALRAMDQKEGS